MEWTDAESHYKYNGNVVFRYISEQVSKGESYKPRFI